jgi:hypothetical protein
MIDSERLSIFHQLLLQSNKPKIQQRVIQFLATVSAHVCAPMVVLLRQVFFATCRLPLSHLLASESKIEMPELVWEILAQIAASAAGTDALVPQNALDLVETVLVPPVASVPFEPAACPVLRMLGGHKAANLIPRVVLLGFSLYVLWTTIVFQL